MADHPLREWWPPDGDHDPADEPHEEVERSHRRPLRLFVLATVPWLILGAFTVVAIRTGGDGAAVPDPDHTATPSMAPDSRPAPVTGSQPTPPRTSRPAGTAQGAAVTLRTPTATPSRIRSRNLRSVDAQAGAAAALAVRRDFSRRGGESGTATYVDLALPVAAVEVGDVQVVEVSAIVLEGDRSGWRQTRTARYAVPTRTLPGGLVAVGRSWPLAAAAPPDLDLDWSSVASQFDEPGAIAALKAAGFRAIVRLRVSASEQLPEVVRATFRGVAPGSTRQARHDVWLDLTSAPRVIGARPDTVASGG